MRRVGEIPQMGYGTWQREGVACFRGVIDALEVGYRHIDTAEGYNNEEFVGTALVESGLKRDEVWITTKVAPESFGPGQVRPHVEASLEKLRLDQVDLLLLHYPSIGDEYAIEDYMAQFVAVCEAGLTRHLGVSNFTVPYIDKALALLGDRPIFTNQIELHPYLANRTIVDHCRAKGIGLTLFPAGARPGDGRSGSHRDRRSAWRDAGPGHAGLADGGGLCGDPVCGQPRADRGKLRGRRAGTHRDGTRPDRGTRQGDAAGRRAVVPAMGRVSVAWALPERSPYPDTAAL